MRTADCVVGRGLVGLTVAALAAVAVAHTGEARTQTTRANFVGVWTIASITPLPADGETALKPGPVTIRQTATSIEIDRTTFGRVTTMTFTIGGSTPDTNTSGAQRWSTTTRWDGAALVTSGTIAQSTSAGYDEWKYTQKRSLDAIGRMVVEETYAPRDDAPRTSRTEWVRQKPLEEE
jgi:hypothetical protein